MSDKEHIEENQLDQMLNNLFLDNKFQESNKNSAQFIFEQEYNVKIHPAKEKQLIDKLNGKRKDLGKWNFLMIAFAIVIVVAAAFFLYKNETVHSNQEKGNIQSISDKQSTNVNIPNDTTSTPVLQTIKNNVSTREHVKEEPGKTKSMKRLNLDDAAIYFPHSGVGSNASATFFKPTAKELLFYAWIKNSMLDKIFSLDKEMYTAIEEDKINYRGKMLPLNSFILRKQTISNLEYKVFLADLLKNNRREDFEKAVVRNEAWVSYNDYILASTYFFDERYNDFPVVNISFQAAALFCEWLEKEINQFAQQRNGEALSFKLRLPFDSELMLAAVKGVEPLQDCDGYSPGYDVKDGLIALNDRKRMELIKITGKSKETDLDASSSINRYAMNENQMLQLFEKGFTYFSTSAADTFYPNKLKIFNKVAHVSEIIQQHGTDNRIIMGSCWKNKKQYNNMLKEFNDAGASPFVGFRIVLVQNGEDLYPR